MLRRETVNEQAFNPAPVLPFELRLKDFELAMQDVYDFFYDVNALLLTKDWSDWTTCFGRQSCPASCPIC